MLTHRCNSQIVTITLFPDYIKLKDIEKLPGRLKIVEFVISLVLILLLTERNVYRFHACGQKPRWVDGIGPKWIRSFKQINYIKNSAGLSDESGQFKVTSEMFSLFVVLLNSRAHPNINYWTLNTLQFLWHAMYAIEYCIVVTVII